MKRKRTLCHRVERGSVKLSIVRSLQIESFDAFCFQREKRREKALPAQGISLSRGLFVILPMAFFLSFAFQMTGVWLAVPVTEIFVSLM